MRAKNPWTRWIALHPFQVWLAGIVIISLWLVAPNARGTVLTWSGGGGVNANWSAIANWGSVAAPNDGDTLIFPAGAPDLINTNNITGLMLSQIVFKGAGGGYGLNGMAFTLTNGIIATNTAGVNNISNSITFSTTTAATNVLVVVSNGVTLTLDGTLGGTMGVTKTGLGTLIYQGPGSNPYIGTTLVSGGTLELNVGGVSAFEGPLLIGDGSGANNPVVEDLRSEQMVGTGPITVNTDGLLNLNNFNEPNVFNTSITLINGTIQTGTGMLTLSANTTINLPTVFDQSYVDGYLSTGSGTLTIEGAADSYLTINAVVSGAANILQSGSVGTDWASANSYEGIFTLTNSAYADIAAPMALGNVTNGLVLDGSAQVGFVGYFNITNGFTIINSAPGAGSIFGDLFLSSSVLWRSTFILSNNCTVNVYNDSTINLSGPIRGPGGFTTVGPGTLELSGATNNTYGGTTTVSAGTLLLDKPSSVIAIPGPLVIESNTVVRDENDFQINSPFTPVTIHDTGLLDLNGLNEWVGPITLQGAQITTESGLLYIGGDITVNGSSVAQSEISGNAILWNGTYTITNAGHNFSPDLVISANLSSGGSGTPGLIKDGAGEVSLEGDNTFACPVTINGGDIWATTSTALGDTNYSVTVSNGGTLFLDGTGLDFGLKPIFLNGTGYSSLGALLCNGSSSWEGAINFASSSQINLYSGSTLWVNGVLGGAGGFTETGSGTLAIGGALANTYGGNTTVDGGLLLLSNISVNGAIPGNLDIYGMVRLASFFQLPTTANVTVESTGLFDLGAYSSQINNLQGSGTANFGTFGWISVGNNNGTSEFDGSFTGIGYSPGVTVYKTGTGTFTIGGNSTYTAGITYVNGGKLVVNGSQPSIPMLVGASAILAGSGTVGWTTNNGIIYPGNTLGILNSSNVLFASTADFTARLSGSTPGTGYDQLSVNGTIKLGNATLTIIPEFPAPPEVGQQFVIITNETGGGITGTFNGLPNGTMFTNNGYVYRINYSGAMGNNVVLTLLGVPGNTITLDAAATGWYNDTGLHNSSNSNYLSGEAISGGETNFYRDWFVFNAPVFTGSVIHAELLINCYSNRITNSFCNYVLRRVTTAPSALEAGGSGLTSIYNNLGTDVVYAVRSVFTNETGQTAVIPLDVQFFNDVTAAAGSQIALGGSVFVNGPPTGDTPSLFAFSKGATGDVQLRLTLGSSEVITATNSGWYTSTGEHTAGNDNYFAGDDGTSLYRDYFLFRLPATSSQLVEAELLLYAGTTISPAGFDNYQLFDVTSPITALTNAQTTATNIYADLGSGINYGGRNLYTNEAGLVADVPLGNGFLGAARAHGNSNLAIGGAMTSLQTPPTVEYFFGATGAASDCQLWLGFTAAPFTLPTMLVTNKPAYEGSGVYQFVVSGTIATTNEIQASFDYVNWDFIGDLPMTGTKTSFDYTNDAVVPYRFFRAEQLQ